MESVKTKRKLKLWQRILIIVSAVIVALAAVLGVAVGCVWGNELSSVASFEKVFARNDEHLDGSVYRMKVKGGFYFDKFLEQGGAENDTSLINFITRNITKGLIDLTIDETEIACASFTATGINCLRGITISQRRIPRSSLPTRARDGTPPFRRSICSLSAWTRTRTSKD